jgi:hypothetical protein
VNALHLRWSAIAFVVGLLAVLPSGCVVTSGGYGYDGGVGIGLDYYEPYGGYYGGWEPGYLVVPSRGGNYRPDRGGGRLVPHAYRPAPASRAVPSIPSHSRSGRSWSR